MSVEEVLYLVRVNLSKLPTAIIGKRMQSWEHVESQMHK